MILTKAIAVVGFVSISFLFPTAAKIAAPPKPLYFEQCNDKHKSCLDNCQMDESLYKRARCFNLCGEQFNVCRDSCK